MKFLISFAMVFAAVIALPAHAKEEGRAADGDEVVLRRLFPKTRTFELELGAGYLLNPTFVDTTLAQASIRYHWSEVWGLGVRFSLAQTQDRDERACVQSFYNDPLHEGSAPCYSQDSGASLEGTKNVNIGPAYPRIRELTNVISVYADYTLAYGKQILLHGATNHFDLRLRFGGAAVLSNVYPERTHIRGDPGRPSRGDPAGENGAPKAGVSVNERDADGLLYGEEGRPDPEAETSPALFFALVQELHFARRFFISGEFGAYAMPSDARGFESFIVANLAAGVRL